MRPKIILPVMGLAVLVLAAAFYFKQAQEPARQETVVAPLPAAQANPAAAHPISRLAFATVQPAPAVTPEEKQAYIESETRRLFNLSLKRDPASLAAILNDLTNSVKEVRLAAIEAVKQVGNRDAIPVLKADVANNPNTDEQIALLSAADFLSLPSIADADVQQPKTPEQIQAAQQRQVQEATVKLARMQQQVQVLQQSIQQQAPSQNPTASPQ